MNSMGTARAASRTCCRFSIRTGPILKPFWPLTRTTGPSPAATTRRPHPSHPGSGVSVGLSEQGPEACAMAGWEESRPAQGILGKETPPPHPPLAAPEVVLALFQPETLPAQSASPFHKGA